MSRKDLRAEFQRGRLHVAARDGDLAAVDRWLTAKYPVNRFDLLGKTPLHYAVAEGHSAVVDRLLRAGAAVNAHDERSNGNTPLSDNIGSMSLAMAQQLIEAGANPTLCGWMQLSALDRAEARTDADAAAVVRLLRHAAKSRQCAGT